MRTLLRNVLIVAALVSLNLRADIITLTDGRTVEGEIVAENATEIVVKAQFGKTTIKREEIQSIEKRKSAATLMREKAEALAKGAEKDKKEAWLKLAAEATESGARDEAQKAYLRVMQIDGNNAEARKALGYVMREGQWVLKSAIKDSAGEAKAADANAKPLNKAAAVGLSGFGDAAEKPVNCPRCNGSGVWIYLPCLNCNKSDKPGYKNLGDHYEIDQRCGGTGKVIGAHCELCNRKGKVMMSHLTPANGGTKAAPGGWAWCPTCSGTGQEKWLQCLQCKRSQWPGYLNLGDKVVMCNGCNGAGKKPALECGNCKGKGLVSAYEKADPQKGFGVGAGQEKK